MAYMVEMINIIWINVRNVQDNVTWKIRLDRKIIPKWIWIILAQDRNEWWELVKSNENGGTTYKKRFLHKSKQVEYTAKHQHNDIQMTQISRIYWAYDLVTQFLWTTLTWSNKCNKYHLLPMISIYLLQCFPPFFLLLPIPWRGT